MDGDSSVATKPALVCGRCGKAANLQCPKCVELKLPREGATFCSQDCFKVSWSTHKSVHKAIRSASINSEEEISSSLKDGWLYCLRKGQARTSKLPHFDWTGSLRPYPISSRTLVPSNIEKPDWSDDGIPKIEPNSDLQRIVEIKTPEQIEKMRETCRIAREVLDVAARMICPGVTTEEIDEAVHQATIAVGGYPSPLNYHFFPKSCCTSVNEVICHGIPDARKLEDGDIVNVDISVYYKGVHGDLNETYFVGNVDESSRQLVQCTYECLEKAISIVKPGVRFREVGEVISHHASMSGLSVVTLRSSLIQNSIFSLWTPIVAFAKHYVLLKQVKSICGHGIGELFHCAPNIPHYAKNKAVGVMKAGHTFTIEPMINAGIVQGSHIYLMLVCNWLARENSVSYSLTVNALKSQVSVGVWRDRMWPDGWTSVTADGKRSAQFEHTLLVTDTGVEVLTARLPTSPKMFSWLNP